jgi:hypothetical protein
LKTHKTTFSIRELVDAWDVAQLRRNPEYQRGAAWSLPQKQALIDSAFREYPLPPLFLEKLVSAKGLGGETSTKYDVVDGQQRLLALHHFYGDVFPLLDTQDKRLRLPTSLRTAPAPWAKKKYSDLPSDLKARLDGTPIDVHVIEDVANPDQVRDLFIRLQSGTALSRQQIRDAWPGSVGPFVQRLAGKLSQRPALTIFSLIDKRGARGEDDDLKDPYVNDRQTCAQFLRIFLVRERDARALVGVAANDLDALYHEQTDLDTAGQSCQGFVEVLTEAAKVFALIAPVSTIATKAKRTKVRKLDAFATVMFFQDIRRNKNLRLDRKAYVALAQRIAEFEKVTGRAAKGTAGTPIRDHYDKFRDQVTTGVGIETDAKRLFDDLQKDALYRAAGGICQICVRPVEQADAEYDHFPIPWRDGGRTTVDNGRLVHDTCHPRGRPAATVDGEE